MIGTTNEPRRFQLPTRRDWRPLGRSASGLRILSLAACLAIAVGSPAIAASLSPGHERVVRTAAISNVIGVQGSEGLVVSLGTALTPAELAPAAGRGTDVPPPARLLTADSTLIALRGASGVDPRQVQVSDLQNQNIASLEVPAQLRYLCPDGRYPESMVANQRTYTHCGAAADGPILRTSSTSPFTQTYGAADPPGSGPSTPPILPCGAMAVSYSFGAIVQNDAVLQAQTEQIGSIGSILNRAFAMEGRVVTHSMAPLAR